MQYQDRRQDKDLREAINRVRTGFTPTDNIYSIFQNTLIEACAITSSPNGWIIEPGAQAAFQQDYRLVAQQQQPALSEGGAANLPQSLSAKSCRWLRPVFSEGVFKLFTASDLADINAEDWQWPTLNSALVIPLIDNRQTLAVMLLANSERGYNAHLAQRFTPLINNAVELCRIVEGRVKMPDPVESSDGQPDWQQLFDQVERNCPFGMITVDADLRIQRVNPEVEKIFAYPETKLLHKDLAILVPEQFPNQHRLQTFAGITDLASGDNSFALLGRRRDGVEVPITAAVLAYSDGEQHHYLLTITDHSEIHDIRAEQAAQNQRFKAVSDLAPIGILQTNLRWEALYANDRWCDISGLSRPEVLGMGWINGLYHQDVSHTLESLRAAITQGEEFDGECRFQTPLGDVVWVELHARPMFSSRGDIDGFIATLTDCTYRHITEHKLRVMAERDALTGLANRALFQDRLQHALQRAGRHGSVALLCLDLDSFKNVNDTLGHDSGDTLLVEVAHRLQSCVRQEDTIARVGGDEFMILMEDMHNANAAAEVSDKILKKLERPCIVANQEVFISTSIGIAFAEGTNADAKTLMKQADIALYRAKSEGRKNFQYYSPELESQSRDRLYLGNCLHRALDRAEFEVFYQLQADVRSKAIVGSEALLRWKHPDRGLLPPIEFIGLLEETGLINPVSRWLWYQAFRDHRRWINTGLISADCRISVNLSPRQLRDPQLVRGLEGAMQDAQLTGNSVAVEITESALIDESNHTNDILRALKALGIKIALDDFGTGYSSLTYLKRFPIDTLKIDQTFIRDLLTDPEDAAITKAVLALAKSLNMTVVSEGVENNKTLALLKSWGCDHFQGYCLHKPASALQTEAFLRNRQRLNVVSLGPRA